MEDLSAIDRHDAGICGGEWAACVQCDIEVAQRMKAAAKVRQSCAICSCEIELGLYCHRCEYKVEQIRMERIYDAHVAAELSREDA